MSDGVGLLLRRAGFGPTAEELIQATNVGYLATLAALEAPRQPDAGAVVAALPHLGLDPYSDMPNPTLQQRAAADYVRRVQIDAITRWWLDRMTVAHHQLTEKLLFFWHGHWATSVEKVMSPQLMLSQHRTIRRSADFVAMARAMVVDPALVYWLDGQLSTSRAPNENLARELMELFLLGIGQYSEADVKEAGRALTGWTVSLGGESCIFHTGAHDGGTKTILGSTQRFTARSLVDHLLSRPACPRFIASRLWYRYASSDTAIPADLRDRMADAFPVSTAMLRILFEHDAFRATAGGMVKQPVEWLVGALRQLGLRPANFTADVYSQVVDGLRSLGQLPFVPPSVGGWPAGGSWLTSAAARVRLSLAGTLAKLVFSEQLSPEELAYVLAIEKWTDRTYAVLKNLKDPHQMLTVGLVSPEYLVT